MSEHMMSIFLQFWGGGFYLFNKVLMSQAERSSGRRQCNYRTWSWITYLVGLPAWVAIFVIGRYWIAASVEVVGAVAMVLGLVIALRGDQQTPKWLDILALVGVIGGIGFSLYDFGGMCTLSQWLELGVVFGFLAGTYLLAKLRSVGYLFFMIMNLSTAWLMHIQGNEWLVLQQIFSLGFVVDAYRMRVKTQRKTLVSVTRKVRI